MDILISQINSVTAIEISGELDAVTAPQAQEQILPFAQDGKRILLDMSNVTYLSSAGLRTLLVIYRFVNESAGRIILTGLREEIRDIMSITGFLDHFRIMDDRSAAIKALG